MWEAIEVQAGALQTSIPLATVDIKNQAFPLMHTASIASYIATSQFMELIVNETVIFWIASQDCSP